MLAFFKSNKTKNRQRLFHGKKYFNIESNNKENDKKNEIIKNIQNFSFLNNFKISNIPSLSIKTEDNTIIITITNYFLKENSFSFTINIRDSYSEILKDFTINPKKENNNFIFNFDSPINHILSNESTKSFL